MKIALALLAASLAQPVRAASPMMELAAQSGLSLTAVKVAQVKGEPISGPQLPKTIPSCEQTDLAAIYDSQEEKKVVGYLWAKTGIYKVYDLEGNLVNIEEEPLEAPLIDPIDAVAGGLAGLIRGGSAIVIKGAARGVLIHSTRRSATSLIVSASPTLSAILGGATLRTLRKAYHRLRGAGKLHPAHSLQ